MTDRWTPPTSIASEISVERTCSMVKVKIEKLEDEEKEKMSFYPKGNSNLMHYLCKHDIASLAAEQGWKLILENIDQKLVIKLLIKNETPVEKCRDKVRELIAKSLPNLHQEKCDLSSLSRDLGDKEASNYRDLGDKGASNYRDLGDKGASNYRDLGDKDPLQQALTCLIPLVTSGQNQADVLYDKDLNCLVIIGPTETVKQLYMDAKVKLYSVTMETVLESPSHGRLLRTLGVIGQLRGQYPDVTVVVQDCNTKVTWTGPEEDIRLGRQVMQTVISEIKTDTFLVSTVMKMLLLTPEIKSSINSLLQQEGIICVWQVTETRQVQVWSMKVSSSKRVGLKIRENFREEAFLVKDFPSISEASQVGFGLTAAEMNHFVVEKTSDTVYVAAKSDTMQKIIQHLLDLEKQQTPEVQPSASQGGDNFRKRTSACTIEVRGMKKRTSNDTVELYFESRRAAGHSVDINKFDASKREIDGVILITYENEEVAQLVLGRQHTLDGSPLTVRLFEALELCPILYQDKVFFRNLNPNTTRKVLENFLRSEVKGSPTDCLYGEERGTVLVTFDGPPDFEKLDHACQKSPLDECVLEANRVPVSHSVLVSGVGKLTSQSTVEYYFENTHRSGGGDVTEVKDMSDGFFVVTFEDPEVSDRVCKREHVVDGQTLTVEIYHEMLGHRLSHTGPVFKVPCPLVITDADPNKIQCIMSSDTTELEKQLSHQHAKLHRPGDVTGHLELECLLTEDVVDNHRLVLSWEEVVRDILSNFLAQAGDNGAEHGMSSMTKSGSNQGNRMGGPAQRMITHTVGQDVVLHKADNPWKPRKSTEKIEEEKKTEVLYRKARGILNKLTPRKFQTLVKQMSELDIDTEERLIGIVNQVYEVAVDDPRFVVAYASMSRYLAMIKVPSKTKQGDFVNFRAILLTRCQKKFELGLKTSGKDIKKPKGEEKEQMKTELEFEDSKARRQFVGNIRFFGELFKLKMITESIMHDCVFKLLKVKDLVSLEGVCCLFTTIRKELDSDKAKPRMEQYFQQIGKIATDKKTPPRVRFLLIDVIELRMNRWVPRKDKNNPKTLNLELKQNVGERLGAGGGAARFACWQRGSTAKGARAISQEAERFSALSRYEDESRSRLGASPNRGRQQPGGFGRPNRVTPRSSQEREKALAAAGMIIGGQTTPKEGRSRENSRSCEVSKEKKEPAPVAAPAPAPVPARELGQEEMENKAISIVDEFLHIQDMNEAVMCVEELNSPTTLHLFVSAALNHVLERSDVARRQTGLLLHDLVKKGSVPVKAYINGLHEILQYAEDMEIDIPQIWQYFGELIGPMIQDGSVPFSFLKDAIQPLKASNKACVLLADILHDASNREGHKKVAAIWKSSGLQWSDFMPAAEVKTFLSTNSLDFTEPDGRQPSTPTTAMPLESIQENLDLLLQEKKSTNEDIFDWIETNLDDPITKSKHFFRVLMTAVCSCAITGRGSSARVEPRDVITRGVLLQKYLDHQAEFELQALYALQSLVHKLEHPPGVLRTLFDALYDEDIISENAFEQWENSEDPAEQEGKGVAMRQVVQFFTWIREAEETSDS